MEFNELSKKRASIRNFSSKKPELVKIIKAIDCANIAPSPGNIPILNFVIVENPKTIEKISKACQQEFIKKALVLVVVCSDSKKIEIMYEERALKYVQQHAGAGIENFLLKIFDLGLASCWVGAFSEDLIKEALQIPDNINIEAVLPIGYQLKTDKTKQKLKSSLDNRLFFETWKNKFQKLPIKVSRESI